MHDDNSLGDDENRTLEVRKATVVRVLWQQPGNDYKILKMDDDLTWKGVVGESVGKGTIIEAEGYMQPARNPSYPDDFQITRVLSILPYSKDGLKTWLMDRLPDIGDARAEELVKKFPGEQLFEVLANEPDRLTEIRGITAKRAAQIQEAYRHYAHERELIVELVTYGIDYLKAQKVAKVRGIREILEEDPFELVVLAGLSFGLVREFVLNPENPYHMEAHDPRMVRAYARELLVDASEGDFNLPVPELRDGGNCYVSKQQMLFMLNNYSGHYSPDELREIVSSSKHIVWLQGGYVLLAELDSAEGYVASVIQKKLYDSGPTQVQLLGFEDTRLDDSQKLAASALTQLPIVVMTGGPGTGKTTTLKAALDSMRANGETVKLAAPTGKAAKRMTETTGRTAQTIHKLLEYGPLEDEDGRILEPLELGFKRNENNPIEADVVVLDECSMLDIMLASHLFAALGGARIVLVGDEDQLPPVSAGQVLTDIMKKLPDGRHIVPTFRLMNTYRQSADSWVIDNAKRIIQGQIPSLKNQSDFQFIESPNKEGIVRAILSIYEESKAKGQMSELQVLCPMKKAGVGASTFLINVEVQKRLNPKSQNPKGYPNVKSGDKYAIFEGDKVIFTKNNTDLGLVNGDTGFVESIHVPATDISETKLLMKVDGMVNPKRDDGLYELGSNHFTSLLLAYAITIHKSQGSEWKEVIVVMDNQHSIMLKRQLLYTAVTRTSRFLRIVGQRSAVERAARSPRSNLRQTLLFQRIQTAK